MLAFKVLLKGLRVWHLCLEKHLKGEKKNLHLKKSNVLVRKTFIKSCFTVSSSESDQKNVSLV